VGRNWRLAQQTQPLKLQLLAFSLQPSAFVSCPLASVLRLLPSTLNPQPSTIWRHTAQRWTTPGEQRGGGPTPGNRRRMTLRPESGCLGPPHTPVTSAEDRSDATILTLAGIGASLVGTHLPRLSRSRSDSASAEATGQNRNPRAGLTGAQHSLHWSIDIPLSPFRLGTNLWRKAQGPSFGE
jgi:hypothetical protein